MQKLQKTVKAIEQREGIKLHARRRPEEALEVLARGTTPYAMGVRAEATCLDFVGNGSKTCRIVYGHFLRSCFGANLRSDSRKKTFAFCLPGEIPRRKEFRLENEYFQRLAEQYPAKRIAE